ncbi:MAG TPA: transposase [Gaiellaceae bacterium]
MLYAAIDIHKHMFQAVTLDPSSGELAEARLPTTREALAGWLDECDGQLVAVEATCGWRWVARELQAAGVEVRLAEPVQARALKGRKRQAKTDKLDARWLATLLAGEMLPHSWRRPRTSSACAT